jgi:hypothetical protein
MTAELAAQASAFAYAKAALGDLLIGAPGRASEPMIAKDTAKRRASRSIAM